MFIVVKYMYEGLEYCSLLPLTQTFSTLEQIIGVNYFQNDGSSDFLNTFPWHPIYFGRNNDNQKVILKKKILQNICWTIYLLPF